MTMRDKTCLVTGASSGIGFETALGLARLGARVGIVGRDARRTHDAAALIARDTSADVDVFVADLSAQGEIRRLAAEVQQRYPRLDVLVNNAGAIFSSRAMSVDGIERTWALDHLAYVQLTLALLDRLRASGPARIVNVASAGHERGRIDFQDLDGARRYGGLKNYCQAKLGNVLFTYALARRLAGSGVTVNAVHPGVIGSRFASEAGGAFGWAFGLFRPLLASPADGAKTSLYVATSPELEGVTGSYFARERARPSSPSSRDEGLQERVWRLSMEQLGLSA